MSDFRRLWAVPVLAAMLMAGCGGEEGGTETAPTSRADTTTSITTAPSDSENTDGLAAALAEGCANVVAVDIEQTGDTYRFDVTVRSADTGPEKYADAWEVRAPDGTVLGVRELLHDHVGEQPFTRSLSNVTITEETTEVTVVARDSVVGFCGLEVTAAIPGR